MKRFALSVVTAVSVIACDEPTRPPASSGVKADVAVAPSTHYTVTDLGSLGGSFAAAVRINAAGEVVGASTTPTGEQHAFRWTARTGLVDLGSLSGAIGSFAWGMNNQGDVVGEADLPSGDTRAVLWTADGAIRDLGTLGGPSALAFAIDDGGEVVGFSTLDAGGPTHAFVWTAQGGILDAGAFNGTSTRLRTINDARTAAGSGNVASGGHAHAVLWRAATGFQDLGTLGNDPSFAATINDAGVVVGFSATADICCHAFRWTQATGMVDLGALSGPDGNSSAAGLDGHGDVVGATTTQADPTNLHAFIWSESGGMRQLVEGAGEFDSEALGINEAGLIVGDGDTPDGRDHALLWKPVGP